MSETDSGIIVPPNDLVKDRNGVKRWAPVFDSIAIEKLQQGGRRVRVYIGDASANFDLSRDMASELSDLLRPSSSE